MYCVRSVSGAERAGALEARNDFCGMNVALLSDCEPVELLNADGGRELVSDIDAAREESAIIARESTRRKCMDYKVCLTRK